MYKKERKKERKYYNSLKLNKVTDNKTFWKAIKPFLSDKGTDINKITFADNDKVILNDKQLWRTFSNFFQVMAKTLGVRDDFNISSYSQKDPIHVIRKYENHPLLKKCAKI